MINNNWVYKIILYFAVSLLIGGFSLQVRADTGEDPPAESPTPLVVYSTRTDSLAPLRFSKPGPPKWIEYWEKQRKILPNRPGETGAPTGGPIQDGLSGPSLASIGVNFEGVNNRNGTYPPDTQGDVGPNHYIQVVNVSFAIWDKTGTLLYGPADLNTIFDGFGGACETTNDGDPIVLYDHLADRWLISQFALPNFPRGPFYECIAISQTPDPTGAWYRYEFAWSGTKMNDYPHFGVWEDGYYMAVNQFTEIDLDWAGQGVAVFERDAMLNGDPARMIQFDLFSTNPDLGGMLPADLDGPAPPSGTPNVFLEMDDDAWGVFIPDQVQVFEFHTDWAVPANSTFTKVGTLYPASFDTDLCGYARNCIPQPGGIALDAISDRLMYRVQYRDFGEYQAMVVNHTVDVNGGDHAGIRWYELRNSGSGWSIYQQSTFSPDSDHRWMGSMAMNGRGEIALGYSVSSTATYPSIRFTGRLPGDPLNQMTQGESTIIAGTGYQTGPDGRWGDYSMMSVDPVDDCTFWYTQEYYATSAGFINWQTRIASFQLQNCELVNEVLPLNAGWNLITLPLQPETALNAQTLLDDINDGGTNCTEINRWLNGAWESHVNGSPVVPFDIQLGEGYFVKCGLPVEWSFSGLPIENAVTIDLVPGWNLVGIPFPASGYQAQNLLNEIGAQGGDCAEVDRWKNSGWDAHIDGTSFNIFNLSNNQGYFVTCNQGSTYTPGQ